MGVALCCSVRVECAFIHRVGNNRNSAAPPLCRCPSPRPYRQPSGRRTARQPCYCRVPCFMVLIVSALIDVAHTFARESCVVAQRHSSAHSSEIHQSTVQLSSSSSSSDDDDCAVSCGFGFISRWAAGSGALSTSGGCFRIRQWLIPAVPFECELVCDWWPPEGRPVLTLGRGNRGGRRGATQRPPGRHRPQRRWHRC